MSTGVPVADMAGKDSVEILEEILHLFYEGPLEEFPKEQYNGRDPGGTTGGIFGITSEVWNF